MWRWGIECNAHLDLTMPCIIWKMRRRAIDYLFVTSWCMIFPRQSSFLKLTCELLLAAFRVAEWRWIRVLMKAEGTHSLSECYYGMAGLMNVHHLLLRNVLQDALWLYLLMTNTHMDDLYNVFFSAFLIRVANNIAFTLLSFWLYESSCMYFLCEVLNKSQWNCIQNVARVILVHEGNCLWCHDYNLHVM